jgi:hypothetical protein
MTLAQKKARENFKKAIEYRKKTGCSLKQAFAHIKGKSTVIKKKATPKKVAVKKAAKKKVGVIKKKAVKKTISKKPISTHKDTKSHNVNIKVVSGIGALDKNIVIKLQSVIKEIDQREDVIKSVISRKIDLVHRNGLAWYKNWLKNAKAIVAELKKHKTELKKFI